MPSIVVAEPELALASRGTEIQGWLRMRGVWGKWSKMWGTLTQDWGSVERTPSDVVRRRSHIGQR